MSNINIGGNRKVTLDDLKVSTLKRLVMELADASDSEAKKILSRLHSDHDKSESKGHEAGESKATERREKNDLADLDEEMHGKPNTPKVTKNDLPYDGDDELPDVPKQRKKRG